MPSANSFEIILETAVRDGKVMQDFESELVPTEGNIPQMVKSPSVGNDSGSKDCVNLPSPTAVSRITVGARGSKLSQAQVWEVHRELIQHHPHIQFKPSWITTMGDKDKQTSLRDLDKTDFFTREVDQLQRSGEFRISIHSAKDLPEPLASGLKIVALTKGVDPADVLVYNHELPANAIIATSSYRRQQNLREWKEGFRFADIRGTIQERLAILDSGQIDGVVMAEAALIRLGLMNRRRMPIPGLAAPMQGRLAVIALSSDHEMAELFMCIHHTL